MEVMKRNILSTFVLLLLLGILLLGYFGRATPTVPDKGRCSSPYDGTWIGTLVGVNERKDFRPMFREGIAFDLTLELSCTSTDGNVTLLDVTEMRASHWPLGCTAGCRPANATPPQMPRAAAFLGPPGSADDALYLAFPNGVSIVMKAEVSSDGKQLRGRSGEPLAWYFGHASRCPELTGQCTPITGSFTLSKT